MESVSFGAKALVGASFQGGGNQVKILALDMATKTGWATYPSRISGVENLKRRPGESRGMLFLRFDAWLEEMITLHRPGLIVYERPHARGRAANEILNGLLAYLTAACEKFGVEYTDCPSTTLKKFATGRGNASKEEMISACVQKIQPPEDDNHADALWLLEWAISQFAKFEVQT